MRKKKEVVEEEFVVVTKKPGRNFIIFISLIVLSVTFLCIGLGIGAFVLNGEFDNKCVSENAKEDVVDKNKNIQYRELFLESDPSLSALSEEGFISSSNRAFDISEDMIGAVFTGENIDEFKIAYTIYNVLDNSSYAGGSDEFDIDRTVLETAIGRYFFDFRISDYDSLKKSLVYNYLQIDLSCDSDIVCHITYNFGGGTSTYQGYAVNVDNVREDSGNRIYTVRIVYFDASNDQPRILYSKNGKLIKEVSMDELEWGKYDSALKYVDENKLISYEIVFDKNHRFVSSKELS